MALNLINSNIKEKEREIKILSSNGIDENTAIVLDNDNNNIKQDKGKYDSQHAYYERNRQKLLEYFHEHYLENRQEILQKRKEHNKLPEVKQRSSEYHKAYYQDHKEELKLKHREYLRNRKNNINDK